MLRVPMNGSHTESHNNYLCMQPKKNDNNNNDDEGDEENDAMYLWVCYVYLFTLVYMQP